MRATGGHTLCVWLLLTVEFLRLSHAVSIAAWYPHMLSTLGRDFGAKKTWLLNFDEVQLTPFFLSFVGSAFGVLLSEKPVPAPILSGSIIALAFACGSVIRLLLILVLCVCVRVSQGLLCSS